MSREYARDVLGRFADIPGVGRELPPQRNAALTQRANTFATYQKADQILQATGLPGKTLDFGAGLGLSKKLGFDTYEPFPKNGFTPDYATPLDIPNNSYNKVTNLNVLNVVPPHIRDTIVKDIGRVLKPGGKAIITTRGTHEVLATSTAAPIDNGDPNAIRVNPGSPNETYQKGFGNTELRNYVQTTLGNNYIVQVQKVGSAKAAVLITKLR